MPKFGKSKNMSKIGKLPIKLPEGVKAEISGRTIVVSGPKGSLTRVFPREIEITLKEGILQLTTKKQNSVVSALYGTNRALLANMVVGVSSGWKKELELVGAGYKNELSGRTLVLNIGFSHPVKIETPEGIDFKVEKTVITIEGIDKELVGRVAAQIRAVRPPEPYQGKGIKYRDEIIRRKPGKAARVAGAVGA